MAGTKAGGKAAAETIKQNHGQDFYKKIGAIGGKKGTTGGFYYAMVNGYNWHKVAGRKGGLISRRQPGTSKAAINRRKRLDKEATADHPDVTDRRS